MVIHYIYDMVIHNILILIIISVPLNSGSVK